jgi:hypothetical protein
MACLGPAVFINEPIQDDSLFEYSRGVSGTDEVLVSKV